MTFKKYKKRKINLILTVISLSLSVSLLFPAEVLAAQFGRPSSNVTQSGFTNGFAQIDEVTASDADFAYGSNGGGNTLEVGLSSVTDPQVSSGHTIRYRVAKVDGGVLSSSGNSVTATVSLYQGGTPIASDTDRTVNATWTEYSFTLSAGQANSITNYSDLRIRIVDSSNGGNPSNRRAGAISWAELEVPDPPITTTLDDGTDPGNVTLAPEVSATDLDLFTFQTSTGSDSITAITVTLAPSGAFNNIAKVEITDASNVDECTDIDNPASLTLNFTGCSLAVTTSETSFKVRITPKTHANMPAVPGASYAVTGTVTDWTGTNTHAGTDTDSATVTIDNLSPGNVTSATASAGNAQVVLDWTNPGDTDFSEVVVLRRASVTVSDTPVEGTNYSITDPVGDSTVACVTSSETCTDSGLTNGVEYYYKIFAKDDKRNYAQNGVVPTGSPATPTAGDPDIVQFHYRWRNDSGDESSADYFKGEDTAISGDDNVNIGDRKRLRIVISNAGTGSADNTTFRLEHSSSSCSVWVPVATDSSGETHWRTSLTDDVIDGSATTDSSGLTNPGGKTFVAGEFKSEENQTLGITLSNTQFIELEFSIRSTNDAEVGLIYCFRVTNAGSTTNFTFNVTPQIILSSKPKPVAGGPPVDGGSGTGVLRGGGNKKDTSPPVEESGDGTEVEGGEVGDSSGDVGMIFVPVRERAGMPGIFI